MFPEPQATVRRDLAARSHHAIENRETRKLVLGTHTGTDCDAPLTASRRTDHRRRVAGHADRYRACPGSFTEQASRSWGSTTSSASSAAAARVGSSYASTGPITGASCRTTRTTRSSRRRRRAGWSIAGAAAGHGHAHARHPKHGRGQDPDSPNHKILLGNGVILVEYLCNLRSLQHKDIELIVLPLKVLGGDGAPARGGDRAVRADDSAAPGSFTSWSGRRSYPSRPGIPAIRSRS